MLTIAVIIIFTVIALFIIISYLTKPPAPNPLDAKNVAVPGVPTETPQEEEQSRISFQVGLLVNQLPHEGQYFSLYYDMKKDVFTLFINPQHRQEGNAQFLDFLKKNGIESESWIQNLNTTYVRPTPGP